MLIYVCSSSHGFGHAARDIAVLQAVHQRRPDWRLVLSSQLNERVLRSLIGETPIQIRPCRWDVGMVQADALGSDPTSTLQALDYLNQQLPELLRGEAEWIRSCGTPALIFGDIPPAAAALADRLDAPMIWMSNFGWDAIYAPFGDAFDNAVMAAREAYGRGSLLLRCPFDLPMDWGVPEVRLPLVCSAPRSLPGRVLEQLEAVDKPMVMIGFGGLGLSITPSQLKRWPDHHFLMAQPTSQAERNRFTAIPNLTVLPPGLRPLDVFPHCQRHLGKPGFSTFCEAMAQSVGLHVVERRNFAEVRGLIQGLQQHSPHRLLSRRQFEAADWQLDQDLVPAAALPLPADGASLAAEQIMALAQASFGLV